MFPVHGDARTDHRGSQSKPPPSVLLGHMDCFELKAIQPQQVQEKLLPLPELPKRI